MFKSASNSMRPPPPAAKASLKYSPMAFWLVLLRRIDVGAEHDQIGAIKRQGRTESDTGVRISPSSVSAVAAKMVNFWLAAIGRVSRLMVTVPPRLAVPETLMRSVAPVAALMSIASCRFRSAPGCR